MVCLSYSVRRHLGHGATAGVLDVLNSAAMLLRYSVIRPLYENNVIHHSVVL